MALTPFSFRKLLALFLPISLYHFRNPKSKNFFRRNAASQFKFQDFRFLGQKQDIENQVLIFNVERTLLNSSSLFPYFMLVAFEAGSLIRSLILFILYPFISLLPEDFSIKVMVMVCFLGLKKERFIEGRAVLPKFFLEDVGMECFQVLRRAKKTVAISNLPRVMVESFLTDYLNIDFVVARDLKVFCGYLIGLMEEKRELFLDDNSPDLATSNAIGVSSLKQSFGCQLFSNCKEIYLVSEQEKRNWHKLARHLYPKPLIFHDGRLAFRPTYLATLAMFMWLPVGFTLAIIRIIIALTFPSKIALSFLYLTGMQLRVFKSKSFINSISKRKDNKHKSKGNLYICNHKTLFDPISISYSLGTPLTAVTYGLSRISEIMSIIKTVRLTRNRDEDAELMHKALSQGDLVVCPEGTTCREPYLLRFSPLFAEISDEIFPVAIDCHVSMFYGTTASGFKCLDPLFFLMNPRPRYIVRFLDVVRVANEGVVDDDGNSKLRMANFVQNEVAKALGFTCTKLTRKNKYMILAGNEGKYLRW